MDITTTQIETLYHACFLISYIVCYTRLSSNLVLLIHCIVHIVLSLRVGLGWRRVGDSEFNPDKGSHLEDVGAFDLDDLQPWCLASRFLDQLLDIPVPPASVFLKVLVGVLIEETVNNAVPTLAVFKKDNTTRAGLNGGGKVSEDSNRVGN